MSRNEIKVIENAKVVLESGIIWDGVILVEGEKITAVGKKEEIAIPESAEHIDACGAYVGPGFVDIHVHGGGGYNTYENPVEAAKFFLSHGETTILATPAYMMGYDEFLKGIRTVKENLNKAPNIRGFYMEGPYTNGNYGCNKDLYTWGGEIKEEQYKTLVDEGGELARVWTIAPERAGDGLVEFLKYARKVNPDTVFAVGHSEALPTEIRALGKYRPTLQTHSMNATGRLKVPGGTRDYGPDEYCFKEPDVYCELISDSLGIHVNREMQQLLLHNKGLHRVVLVSDSTVYDFPNPEAFKNVPDLNFDSKGGIAGSKLTMDMACKNVMSHTNCGIAQAFIMASTNPAKAIGLYDELGSIEIGKRADFVFVDDIFSVKKVVLGGEICKFD